VNAVTLNMLGDSDDAFRASVVGASEVPALFDASPWLTRFELWHRKNGTIATPEFGGDERIQAGIFLEPSIIQWACAKYGYEPVEKPRRLDNGAGLGGHPDALVRCPERGTVGILEVKMVDWLVFKKWGDEPPLHYLLQAQTYAGLAKVEWADIVYTVGGNSLNRHQEAARPALFEKIEARVAAFWTDVRAGIAPVPDYARDGAALIESLGLPTDEVADLRDSLDAEQEAMDFLAGKALRDQGEAQMDAAKCRLIERIGTAGVALLPGHRIGANRTKDTPDREAKPGEIIKGRRGYRRFDVKEIAA
jgi:hypothetical protein